METVNEILYFRSMCEVTMYDRVRKERIRPGTWVKGGTGGKGKAGHPVVGWSCYENGGKQICPDDSLI